MKKFSLLVLLLLVFPLSVFAANDLTFDEHVTVEITTTDEADDTTFLFAAGSTLTQVEINADYVDLTLDAGSDFIVASVGDEYFEFEVISGSGANLPDCAATGTVNVTSTGSTVVRMTLLSVDPECEEEEQEVQSGSSSSGSAAAALNNSQAGEGGSSYAEEVQEVRDKGLVEKELDKNTDKCEALTIMARSLVWKYDESVTDDGFSDTPDWCKPVAKYARDMGYIKGRSDGVLGLDTPMNRFEFVVILFRILDGEAGSVRAPYSDAIMTWAAEAVNWAYAKGYMTGYANGTFGGENGILKQDVGVVMLRITK